MVQPRDSLYGKVYYKLAYMSFSVQTDMGRVGSIPTSSVYADRLTDIRMRVRVEFHRNSLGNWEEVG